jgi:hypothetical protein
MFVNIESNGLGHDQKNYEKRNAMNPQVTNASFKNCGLKEAAITFIGSNCANYVSGGMQKTSLPFALIGGISRDVCGCRKTRYLLIMIKQFTHDAACLWLSDLLNPQNGRIDD